jgi:hypothetical protein
MAKQRNSAITTGQATVQLHLIDFDAVDALEAQAPEVEQSAAQADPRFTTETEVLQTVPEYDAVYADDPLAAEVKQLALDVKAETDSVDKAVRFVSFGARARAIMIKRHNIAPGAYSRKKAIELFQTQFALCNVPTSVKVQEMIAVYMLVQLVRSIPGGEGEPRSMPSDEPSADWFGGNLTESVLRVLVKCTHKVSGDKELDVWEFNQGYEANVRDWVSRLRNGHLSVRQVIALIEHRGKVIEAEASAAKWAGLTQQERESLQDSEANKQREAVLRKLGAKALDLQEFAATELKQGKEALRDFLISKQIIPPVTLMPAELAARLTPGDAKALVQELIKQYPTHPDRMKTFKALYQTCAAVVKEVKSAQSQPAAKAG